MFNTISQLDTHQLHDLKQLKSACKKVDGSTPNLYLHLLTQSRALPSIILNYKNKQLIGFLSIYFFYDDAVEVALLIHPKARRKGIARTLIKSILPLIQNNNYHKLIFSSAAHLNNSWLLEQGFSYLHSEYCMEHTLLNPLPRDDKKLTFRSATLKDIPQLCLLDEACFHKKIEEQISRFEYILMQQEYQIIMAFKDHDFIGKAHLRWQNKEATLSDIAVFPEQQGLGLGTALISYCLNYALSKKKPKINLDVETHNKKALELYTRLSFRIENASDYWSIDVAHLEKSFLG